MTSSTVERGDGRQKDAQKTTASAGKSVAVVLGSGGARGLVHIGVLRALEARGYRIAAISGSSMGALIGGIYATGKLDLYADWATTLDRLDVLRLMDVSIGGAGLIRGTRVLNVIREMIGEYDIESLPIRFTAVAAELETGRERWLDRGSLFDAIRASVSIPGLLYPASVDGTLLIDGGVVDPLPIGPTMAAHTDLVVVSDVNGPRVESFNLAHYADVAAASTTGSDEEVPAYRARFEQFVEGIRRSWGGDAAPPPEEPAPKMDFTAYEVMLRAMDAVQGSLGRYKLAAHAPDLVVRLPRNACTFMDFHRAAELIVAGEDLTNKALDGAGSRGELG